MPKPMRARTATPPTTPPTMAPTGVEEPDAAAGEVVATELPVWDAVVVEERRLRVEVAVSTRTVCSKLRPAWPGYVVEASCAVETRTELQK